MTPASIEATEIGFMWAFQAWAGERLFAAAALAPDLRQPGAIAGGVGDGSVHDTLAHLAATERHWLRRWEGDPHSEMKSSAAYPHLASIVDEWRVTHGRRVAWLASLPRGGLDEDLRFYRSDGSEDRQVLWQTVLHVSNHTTHHRAEACTALTAMGIVPESVDLIDFMRAGSPSLGEP